jgi:hypothetical protein
MDQQGLPRMPHEGAWDYCCRLLPVFPDSAELVAFLTLYNECKYGTGYNSGQLSNLKKLLPLCLQLKPLRTNSTSSAFPS